MPRSPAWIASLLVALASLAALGLAAAADDTAEPCCSQEDLGPGELRPGIFDCCPDCRETRIYRSEILGRLWVRGEYLSWAIKGQEFPPLVTASLPGTASEDTGVLGRPGTHVLFGDEEIGTGMRPGGRLTGGFWWHPDQMGGIEASYFELDEQERAFSAGRGPLLIARPYFNVNTLRQDSLLVQHPDVVNGSVSVSAASTFNGADVLLRHVVSYGDWYRVDVMGGYRYSRLDDDLRVIESLDPLPDVGVHVDALDLFNVENEFHGAEAGAVMRWRAKYVGLQLLGKFAMGSTTSKVTIDGGTATTTSSQPGALLALPTNIGCYSSTGFSAIEELGISMDLWLTCNCRAMFGYTLIYWSNVARVADQIDLAVNPSQIPPGTLSGPPRRPTFDLKTTDFWAQGLNIGLEYQF